MTGLLTCWKEVQGDIQELYTLLASLENLASADQKLQTLQVYLTLTLI